MTNYDQPTGSTGTKLRLVWTYSQSASDNSTTVKLTLQLVASQHTGWANGLGASLTIGGHTKSFTYDFDFTGSSLTKTIGSYSYTYAHNADGTAKGSYSISGHIDGTDTSSVGGPTTVSGGSHTAPRIPKPPSSVRDLSRSDITGTGARIDWSPPSDDGGRAIDMYHVHVSKSADFSDYDMVYEGLANHYNLSGLSHNTRYYVRVIAHNSVGWNTSYAAWPSLYFTTLDVPDAPTNLSVTSVTSSAMTFPWSPNGNGGASITGYQAQVSTSSNMSGATSKSTSGTSARFTGLTRATAYFFRVRAQNSVGWSGWSGVTHGTTASTEPSAPRSPSVGSIEPTSVSVAFSAPSDDGGETVSSYQVQYSTSSSFSGATTVSKSSSPVGVSGLTPGTTYFFRVRAQNSVGWSDWSATVSAKTKAGGKVWNGSAWVPARVRVWDGSAWRDAVTSVYEGGWKTAK